MYILCLFKWSMPLLHPGPSFASLLPPRQRLQGYSLSTHPVKIPSSFVQQEGRDREMRYLAALSRERDLKCSVVNRLPPAVASRASLHFLLLRRGRMLRKWQPSLLWPSCGHGAEWTSSSHISDDDLNQTLESSKVENRTGTLDFLSTAVKQKAKVEREASPGWFGTLPRSPAWLSASYD